MTRQFNFLLKNKLMRAAYLCFGLLLSSASPAALVDLATAPLANSTTSLVLPNLMYILDNSGSMRSDYMPDYVNDTNKCKSTATGTSATIFSAACGFGDPAYNLKDFNTLYYNPEITYLPTINGDGSIRPSMNSANTAGWTNVPNDPYGIRNVDQLNVGSTSISLIPNLANTQGYPADVWCNTTSATTADLSDPSVCNRNDQYVFPTSVFNNAYTLRGYPYYYTNTPSEYCTNKDLTTCQATASATYNVPATLRWCSDAARTTCQAKYKDGVFIYAKWLGITTGTVSGTIKIKADPTPHTPATSVTPLQITNVTVAGVRIIPLTPAPALTITNTTIAAQRASLASALASNINSYMSAPDYTATAAGDTVTVTPVAAGALTATIVVTTSTATAPLVTTTNATGSFRITKADSGHNISSIRVGSVEILNQTISTTGSTATARRLNLANAIVARVNSYVSSTDYNAVRTADAFNNQTITFTAVVGGTAGNGALTRTVSNTANITIDSFVNLAGGGTSTTTQTYILPTSITNFTGGVPVVATFNRVDIEPSTANYVKAETRTDCTGAVGPVGCSYDEEMTNFANWYSYYRTRMQMMKTSTSRAFKDIDTRFRVGFITISNASTNYLPIAKFDDTQKTTWYNRLFAADGSSGTPLRSALTTTGRIFAGKGSAAVGNSADPMQYSCQQNFTLLTTDGYWNTDTTTTVRDINGTGSVGNLDGGTTPKPLFEGTNPTYTTSNTLADAAKYYYDTDLRDASLSNCTGSAGVDVCTDNVFVSSTDNNVKQHMTTFTLGLGVDGALNYTSDYKTQTVGDFNDLKNGTIPGWPVPVENTQTAVDDLWHAAVNGRGTYFSAKNPTQLTTSLGEALSAITSKVGAGAAAATSTLNPVAGDNFAYVASYATVKWTGNIEGRTIDIATGEVSVDAAWCTESIAAGACSLPSTVVSDTTGSSTNYFCSTPGKTLATCPTPGILDGTNCKVEIASACTGTMLSRVAAATDDRKILMQSPTGLLVPFNFTNITSAGKAANFQTTFLASSLSQWTDLTVAQQTSLTSDKLVDFLRGQSGYEDRASNVVGSIDNRLFRFREAVIGDPLESTPAFNGIPKATYTDPGYGAATVAGTFAYAQSLRDGTVYIGTNDGMLHAFDADNGVERWAYVPTMVMPNMWKLADKNYSNLHTNYVNGDPIINDVCTANCSTSSATWKTILVGGLNGGGTGYYALDITDPDNPISLWEFDTTDDADLGYTFGNPIITKKADGTWVVLVTSGYNNVSGSAATQGKGFFYVLDVNADITKPGRAKVLTKYNTGEGNATTPSGLAKISAYITDAQKNNTALYIYGGDLLGNLWRFDINNPQSSGNPFKLAKLQGSLGDQPITVKPELSEVEGKRIVFVGTGKYLESTDVSGTQTPNSQTLYAITDANETVTLNNPRSGTSLQQQVITTSSGTRTVTNNPVLYASKRGWYIDLPDPGERQNVPSQLVFGTLLVPTIVPSNTVCSPGGYGWLNFINFKTGSIIAQSVVGSKTNAPIVGINVLYVNGSPKVSVVTADNPTPEFPPIQPEFLGGTVSGFQDRRVIWRELIEEQQ